MVEKFHEELDALKREVVDMGALARSMLKDAVESFRVQDPNLAESVIAKKRRLAEYDADIEEKALRLIALYQPVATDMRTLATCLKLNTYLARVGRYGKDIAAVSRSTASTPHVKKIVHIPQMSEIVDGMIADSLASFESCDIARLKDMPDRDTVVDEMRYGIYRECLALMMADPRNIDMSTHYIMISRYLERCGDHACKMAEKVNYMATGEHVEIK